MGIGTLAYMAPEVYGRFQHAGQALAYSETVDMWAIGIITYELLCNEYPFSDSAKVLAYTADITQFPDSRLVELQLEELCVDFIRGLMMPNPTERLTSSAALQHPWMATAAAELEGQISDSGSESK